MVVWCCSLRLALVRAVSRVVFLTLVLTLRHSRDKAVAESDTWACGGGAGF